MRLSREPDLAPLQAAIERFAPVPVGGMSQLQALLRVCGCKRGEHVLRVGEPARDVHFVCRGLLREYYVDSAGREATSAFCAEGEFSGSLTDLLSGGASTISIQALEDCELWQLEWQALDALTQTHVGWLSAARRVSEHFLASKVQRERELLQLDSSERYRRFARDRPALNARLPRQVVASYLGMTPAHLSRVCAWDRSLRERSRAGRPRARDA